MVKIVEMHIPKRNTFKRPGIKMRPTSITIHETANESIGANAEAHARLQSSGNSRMASWHYQVDDKKIIQSYPHTARCWHAGSATGNNTSIGIEVCVNADGDFKQAVKNAADLVRHIMNEENIPLRNVVQHNKWSGKDCPRYLRNGSRGISWHRFISMVDGASVASNPSIYHLEYGDTGETVKCYQEKLKRAGYNIVVDGSFGPAMRSVVQQFQRDNKLTVDGLLGPATQKRLDEVLTVKKEDEQLNLNKNERAEIARIFRHARESGIFSSAEHEKTIVDGTMTLSRLQYLQTIIAGAGINDGKRIK